MSDVASTGSHGKTYRQAVDHDQVPAVSGGLIHQHPAESPQPQAAMALANDRMWTTLATATYQRACRQARMRFPTGRTQPNVRFNTTGCSGVGYARHLCADLTRKPSPAAQLLPNTNRLDGDRPSLTRSAGSPNSSPRPKPGVSFGGSDE